MIVLRIGMTSDGNVDLVMEDRGIGITQFSGARIESNNDHAAKRFVAMLAKDCNVVTMSAKEYAESQTLKYVKEYVEEYAEINVDLI